MDQATKDDIRQIVREETTHLPTSDHIDDLEATLNEKMEAMLKKMDAFITGLEREKQERQIADHQVERRVEALERRY